MNHTDAIKLGACEKYLLGELSASVREEFEEHYFGCSQCASDIQSASLFMAASRQALAASPASAPQREAAVLPGWFAWLRPAFVVPVFALLLVVVGYQNFVTVPHLRSQADRAASSAFLKPVLLHPGLSRGSETRVASAANQPASVYLDIPTRPSYSSYLVRLEDSAGKSVDLPTLFWSDIQSAPLLSLPSDLKPGAYTIHVLGQPEAGNSVEVANFSFLIEISGNIEQH